MDHGRNLTTVSPLARPETAVIAFSDQFRRLSGKSSIRSEDICVATQGEVLAALDLARETLPVAGDDTVRAVFDHNPECFRIVRKEPFSASLMMAYLPLTMEGAAALVDGQFDAAAPSLRFICRPGESPDAIYLWLVYVPRNMIAGLRLLQELETIGQGVAIFTWPAHEESRRILSMSGFIRAQELFPSAPDPLLVALTLGEGAAGTASNSVMTVRVARDLQDIAKIIAVRTATYMVEQSCTFSEEFDGNDFTATHLIGEVDGEPAGCVRIRYFGGFAKLERLAIRPEYRRSRLMWKIVKAAFEFCSRKGFSKLYAHAREDLVPAWERFGAKRMEGREPFCFSDVRFVEMQLQLPPHQRPIQLGADPMLIIRPEGNWDELGPIDKAQLKLTSGRQQKNMEFRRLK